MGFKRNVGPPNYGVVGLLIDAQAAGAVLVVEYRNGEVGCHLRHWPKRQVGAGGCSAVGGDDARIWLTMKA
jgi:hypothetical protein